MFYQNIDRNKSFVHGFGRQARKHVLCSTYEISKSVQRAKDVILMKNTCLSTFKSRKYQYTITVRFFGLNRLTKAALQQMHLYLHFFEKMYNARL